MNDTPGETTTIEVEASHPRLAVPMYTGTHVEVEIDGEMSSVPWGGHSFRVAPGRHSVVVRYRGFNNHGNPVSIWVEAEAGRAARVVYRAPKFGGQDGTLESDNAIPEPDDLPQDLTDLSDAELVEAWNAFRDIAGRDPFKRLLLRKMRREFEQEMERRGLAPESLGFER